ncbi:MAG: SDR family NAD(P)-dependent oxidoreductase [Phaeospirillum sp.]|nr:SDR family NAD(P)-dependent oxidoreductase [Phaeospirillum sp.]
MTASLGGARILVTGGAGFIGSALVRLLAAHGADVVVLDNLVNGKRENLAGLDPARTRLAVADIRDDKAVEQLLDGVDVVYHLACLGVRNSIHAPLENHEVNADATLRLLLAARRLKVGRFVTVSTSEVYGTCRFTPMTEDHPTLTKTVYGGSKLAGESYTRAFWETYGYPTVVVRPFNAFGPRCHHEGDSGEVIPKFMLRALAGRELVVFGDGSQTRDFTFVEDTARAILLAGVRDAAVGETINVGQGAEITVTALAKAVADCLNRDVTITHDQPRPGDVIRLLADSAKAEKLLGYAPEVSLADGLARLRDWYLASGKSAEDLLRDEVVHNWTQTPASA